MFIVYLITNDVVSKRVHKDASIPEGYRRGKINNCTKGTIWITNGIDNKRVKHDSILSIGWYKGHTNFRKKKEAIAA